MTDVHNIDAKILRAQRARKKKKKKKRRFAWNITGIIPQSQSACYLNLVSNEFDMRVPSARLNQIFGHFGFIALRRLS